MNNKNMFKNRRSLLLALALVLLLSVSLAAGGSYAKYSKTVTLKGVVKYTVPSTAMAGVSLSSCEPAYLIPGTTVSGSSAVTVEWTENALPAYLYVELTGDHASEITALGDDWTKLDVTGNVFVYNGGTALEEAPAGAVPVAWSFTLGNERIEEKQTLTITAYLIEQKEGVSAEDTYLNKGADDGPAVSKDSKAQKLIPADVSCTVNDDYTVTNTGDIDVLIRAAVVTNWVNADDEVGIGNPPVTYGDGWTELTINGDTYLFYNGVLTPDGTTTPVVASVDDSDPPDDDFTAQVTVLAESIQTEPASAAQSAWGATYSEGAWTVNP